MYISLPSPSKFSLIYLKVKLPKKVLTYLQDYGRKRFFVLFVMLVVVAFSVAFIVVVSAIFVVAVFFTRVEYVDSIVLDFCFDTLVLLLLASTRLINLQS
jgi:hypothetical protein